jgi:hypothetical protein
MSLSLTKYQRSIALHRITFDHLLSPELEESLRRASLAGAENNKPETGIIEFVCGLYLQYQKEVADHFRGDFAAVLKQNFPKHRFGNQGFIPEATLDKITSDDDSGGFGWDVKYSDELLRLLWLATTLANAVGKRTSLKDVLAAITQDRRWMNELLRCGLQPVRKIASFQTEVETVVFYATIHMSEHWPRQLEFQYDGILQPPFTLEASTPSGGFQPVRSAKIKLNGNSVAEISWSGVPTASLNVELLESNKIELELDGPTFGSVEVTLRGNPPNSQLT